MHRHRTTTSGHQPDLFPPPQSLAAATDPTWSDLPDVTREALTALVTRLLISHAAGAAPGPGGDAGER
jgi:hypothetical protein